jgi:hypothetical protein
MWAKANPTGCIVSNQTRKNCIPGAFRNPNNWLSKTCPTCSAMFETRKNSPRKFCSPICVRTGGYRKESFRFGIKGSYQGIHCDSTWELAFLIFNLDHLNHIERAKNPLFYVDQTGMTKKYYPDFKVNGVLIEIKGRFTEIDRLKLKANPNVKLLLKDDLVDCFSYIKTKYNISERQFKVLYD